MRRLLAIVFLLFGSPAWATNYYFSGCGCAAADACRLADCDINPGHSGCGSPPSRGTVGNPWCLNPEAAGGSKSSFDAMMDAGAGTTLPTELAAGDTVFLCAGACDGSGSETWYLAAHASPAADNNDGCPTMNRFAVFDYEVDGGTITIKPYPGETVTLSGDANNNNVFDAGEAGNIISTADCDGSTFSGHGGYVWDGDPDGDGVPNLIIQKWGAYGAYDVNSLGDNTYQGLEMRYGNSNSGAQEFFQCTGADCDNVADDGIGSSTINCAVNDSAAFAIHSDGGTKLIQNNIIHHVCFASFRTNGNCLSGITSGSDTAPAGCTSGITALNILNNRGWNVGAVYNSHQVRNVTIQGNHFTDFNSGIGLEEQNTNILVDNNYLGILGDYDTGTTVSSFGKSPQGIECNDGDSDDDNDAAPGSGDTCCDGSFSCQHGLCTAADIRITNNRVFGTSSFSSTYGNHNGYLMAGVVWRCHNSTGGLGNSYVENNFIWYTQDSDSNFNVNETSIGVENSDPITFRNNTVFNGGKVYISGGAHVFENNLIVKGNQVQSGNVQEVQVTSTALGSTVQFNDFSDYGDGGTVATINATSYTCAQVNSTPALGLASGASNKCAAPTLENVSGSSKAAIAAWDIHLATDDVAAKDAGSSFGGGVCATLDIDSIVRSGKGAACDIGADEIGSGKRRVTVSTGE